MHTHTHMHMHIPWSSSCVFKMIAIMLFDYGIMLDMRAIIMFAVPSRPSQLMPPALCSCATLPMLLSTYIPIQTPLHSRAADTGACI